MGLNLATHSERLGSGYSVDQMRLWPQYTKILLCAEGSDNLVDFVRYMF